MSDPLQLELTPTGAPVPSDRTDAGALKLDVTIDKARCAVRMEWRIKSSGESVARVSVAQNSGPVRWREARWEEEFSGQTSVKFSSAHHSSIRARLNRLKQGWPVADEDISARAVPASTAQPKEPPELLELPKGISPWQWLAREIVALLEEHERRMMAQVSRKPRHDDTAEVVERRRIEKRLAALYQPAVRNRVHMRLNYRDECIELLWSRTNEEQIFGRVAIRCTARDELTWLHQFDGVDRVVKTSGNRGAIREELARLQEEFPVSDADALPMGVFRESTTNKDELADSIGPRMGESPWDWLAENARIMAREFAGRFDQFAPREWYGDETGAWQRDPFDHETRRLQKIERQQQEQAERLRQRQTQIEQERQRREQARLKRDRERAARHVPAPPPAAVSPSVRAKPPLPPLQISIARPEVSLQETLLPLTDLRGYFLRERAAQWWISNQTDNLLCLPFCRIEQLEYQIRTALRVLGPLRGRALLSDEVGLGKTIEAGLVLKELLTRGMAKRFLVLTVPSLVDQWQEELADKFGLNTATTNGPEFRADSEKFWRESRSIVASLHTLKQPAHLAIAQSLQWDVLVVDEAHYLRNRASQAWQAVNALPRQFLLLLTATPVQNSIEELYNLVMLLQPGQLPSPKEFRARFIDPAKPHQPREPEELRRLLGQVMIRNTRANAGINLPPRRAETVSFEPDANEREFWTQWETELREQLAALPANQSTLWGRLLLQSAGSSPAAWREVLQSFPQREARDRWLERAPLEASWTKKCELLQPLTRGEGGVVIFTQFLQTQAAVAERLRRANAPVFVINGQTPAEQRHPITEEFRKYGGALLLTHSGTEGRNLQFCHRLVNFDLPWNPMEIEQRIGRLHRLGQKHPVRIYNFVQTGTLQEHLLHILQEKLNLFELVVGETGLILGDRFTSDEFAEEVLRRWRDSEGRVAEAMHSLGDELAAARESYNEVKKLDETLFAKDYESI